MPERRIKIPNYDLTYVELDEAIRILQELRKEHGGKAMLDITLEPVPYENCDEIEVSLIVKE